MLALRGTANAAALHFPRLARRPHLLVRVHLLRCVRERARGRLSQLRR